MAKTNSFATFLIIGRKVLHILLALKILLMNHSYLLFPWDSVFIVSLRLPCLVVNSSRSGAVLSNSREPSQIYTCLTPYNIPDFTYCYWYWLARIHYEALQAQRSEHAV
jgi:hypothetical protein